MPYRPPTHRPPGLARPAPDLRPSAHERGYDRVWQKLRAAFLAYYPTCAHCEAQGLTVPAQHVDHIEPITSKDDPRRLDWSNLQALCAPCHTRKTKTEDRGKGRAKAT